MKEQTFFLEPSEKEISVCPFAIKAGVSRTSELFFIRWEFCGDLSGIVIPEKTEAPVRKNNLWQNTCLEFFIAVRDLPQYREFNLSPSGDWNVYSFQNYREGMKEEPCFSSLPFRADSQGEFFQIELACELGKIIDQSMAAEIGVSTVVKHKNGELSYWALKHCGSKPDFHLRESFILKL